GAVFSLVARVGRDVAACTPGAVIGVAVVDVVVRPTPGEVTVVAVRILSAHPATNLDAHIRAGHVVETDTIERANLHVLDGLTIARSDNVSNRNLSFRKVELGFIHSHLPA